MKIRWQPCGCAKREARRWSDKGRCGRPFGGRIDGRARLAGGPMNSTGLAVTKKDAGVAPIEITRQTSVPPAWSAFGVACRQPTQSCQASDSPSISIPKTFPLAVTSAGVLQWKEPCTFTQVDCQSYSSVRSKLTMTHKEDDVAVT
jgi:hypothetical protein